MAEPNQMTAISDGVWANSAALDHLETWAITALSKCQGLGFFGPAATL
jgi:hypothetical protein